MSILGVGTDIVSIDRIAHMLEAHSERLAVRLLASAEMADYQLAAATPRGAAAFLARRFAAKEAGAKALGCGIGAKASFRELVVEHTPAGAPRLALSGKALETANQLGVAQVHLSISDEHTHATAVVILER